jgi:hypothetical protein
LISPLLPAISRAAAPVRKRTQQQVLWLDIAVYNILRVEVREPVGDLANVRARAAVAEAPGFAEVFVDVFLACA